MSAAISGVRVKFGLTDGDVRVTRGGRLVLFGMVAGTLTVEAGGYANIIGMVDRLVIESGARAQLRGVSMGDVTNHGGHLTISGAVKGVLHGRVSTHVRPRARIDHFAEPVDPATGQGPLPEAADLASRVIDDLTNARWSELRARFDGRLHDSLTEEELAAPWRRTPGSFGIYQGRGDTDAARVGDLTRTVTPLHFDTGTWLARISFRDDQTIAGLRLGPEA
jgi:hypothetical protein